MSDEEYGAFQQILTRWKEGIDASDAAAMSALFTPDGIVSYPDDRPPSVGRDAVEADCAKLFASERATGSAFSPPVFEVHGDWAQIVTDFRASWIGASSIQEHSRYFLTMRRQPKGTWLIARFTFYPLS